MESTLGQHKHQEDWTVTYEDREADADVQHFKVHTCNVCGCKFIHRQDGPKPEGG